MICATRRPLETDADIREAAAQRALPELESICGDELGRVGIDALMKLLDCPWQDGFERGKRLESMGWNVNFELCEWLNDLDASGGYRAAVKKWVADNSIVCPFKVSDTVSVPHLKGGQVTGVITGINTEEATATVCCESLGHVREGIGTNGFVIKFEDLR